MEMELSPPKRAQSGYRSMQGYDSVSTRDEDASDQHPQPYAIDRDRELTGQRPWRATILTQAFALLWIAPILALLILNFSQFVIGPTAWCPSRQCYAELFNLDTNAVQQKLREFDKADHDLLGALQLVAKALEVWFEAIAGFLVYLVTMKIASKPDGLPIGYIMSPFEFSRLPALFDTLLWKVAPGLFTKMSKHGKRFRRRIYLFILLIIVLCAVCNLMGPSTAVLVLPVLQWVDTEKIGNRTFVQLNSAEPPRADTFFLNGTGKCTAEDAIARNYSCTYYYFGVPFDSWVESSISGEAGGITQQDVVSFQLNTTFKSSSDRVVTAQYNNTVYWASNRQLLSTLAQDWLQIAVISEGYDKDYLIQNNVSIVDDPDTYVAYNKSLQLTVQRNGPVIGSITNDWIDLNNQRGWVVSIDDNRQLRCYGHYDLADLTFTSAGNYTKCVQRGSGWSQTTRQANFTIEGSYNHSTRSLGPSIYVNSFASDKAALLENGTIPAWLSPDCLINGTVPSGTECDYERLFTVDPRSPVANRSTNVNTIEFEMRNGSHSAIFVVDYVAFLSFTTYQMNASPLTNPLAIVRTENIPETNSSIYIDPNWTLAAWSADSGGTQSANRTSTILMEKIMGALFYQRGLDDDAASQLYYMAILPVAQTLSLIDYDTKVTTAKSTKDQAHPLLQRNAQMYVWAYNISSRTARLGAIVACLGIVVVLVQFALSIFDRRPFNSSTQLVIAALEHAPRDEFVGKRTEQEAARVKFHIRDGNTGRLTFRHLEQ